MTEKPLYEIKWARYFLGGLMLLLSIEMWHLFAEILDYFISERIAYTVGFFLAYLPLPFLVSLKVKLNDIEFYLLLILAVAGTVLVYFFY